MYFYMKKGSGKWLACKKKEYEAYKQYPLKLAYYTLYQEKPKSTGKPSELAEVK